MEYEKLKNLNEMEKALDSRDAKGHKYAMTFFDEPATEKYYPHFKRGPHGERAMVFADEFADGQTPEDLEYVPGHEKPGEQFDGTNFDVIVYNDPTLNLPYAQWLQLQAPTTENFPGGMCPLPPAPPNMVPRLVGDDDEQSVVFSTPKGLMLQTKHDTIKLTNFGLMIEEKRVLKREGKDTGIEIGLVVQCLGGTYSLTLDAADIDGAVKIIQKKHPQCRLLVDTKRAISYAADFIREQLPLCPEKAVYLTPGFTQIGGGWHYVHDGARSPSRSVFFRCGKEIGRLPDVNAVTAFQYALNMLALCGRLELILPLVLLLHLGPLFNLFRAAGCPPRFVTFLAGTTGSMKTSLALCIYNLFDRFVDKPAANFFDTENALEKKLGTAYSQVFLVDDFCPAVTSSNGKEKLARLEKIIRFVGDQITKSRCTPDQSLAAEYAPVGCCIVTGENTGGSRSSLLRCLVLPINKGDIDGKKLAFYQSHPLYLQTHMCLFLEWAGAHGNELIWFLQQNFLEERQAFTPSVHERRLVDTGATLMLAARIILQYAVDISALSADQATDMSTVWRHALEQALYISESNTKDLDPLTMYVYAVLDLRNSGKLPLAATQSAYVASEHVGYINGDTWWLRPEDLYQSVVRYWKGLDQMFPLRDSDIRKLLAQNGLIEVEHSTRNGEERVSYTRKTTLEGRPRMLVLRVEAARKYLDSALDDE